MALANLVFAQQVNTQEDFKSVKRFSLTLLPGSKTLFIPFVVSEQAEIQDIELHFWEYNEKFLRKVVLDLFCMWFSTVGLQSFPSSQLKKIQIPLLLSNKGEFSASCLEDFWITKQ